MKVELASIRAGDLVELVRLKGTNYLSGITEEQAKVLESTRYAYSILIDGKVYFCGGVTEYWPGRGEAWAILHPNCKREFVFIHNAVKRYLDICPVKRVEAAVERQFQEGHRWVKSLGFTLEAERLKAFFPDGKDAALYARVRED